MKNYFTFLILSLVLTSILIFSNKTTAQNLSKKQKNDWAEMNLKGQVMLMWESIYNAKGDDETQEDSIVYFFSDKGYKIKLNNYKRKSYINKQTFTYDENGDLVERNFYNPDGSLIVKFTHKHDDKENHAEDACYKPGGALLWKS